MHKKHLFSFVCHWLINIMLVAMIVVIYVIMTNTRAVSVLGSNIIYRTDKKNAIALECVLAWQSENIDELLKVLEKEQVKISFVVSGTYCEQNPEVIRRIVTEGHSLATCAMNYNDTARLSTDKLAASIKKSVGIIEKISGGYVEYYYSPAEDTVKASRAARAAGLDCVRCSTDLLAARGSSENIVKRAKESAKGASIVAFTPTANLISALPEVFEFYRSIQLEIVAVMS